MSQYLIDVSKGSYTIKTIENFWAIAWILYKHYTQHIYSEVVLPEYYDKIPENINNSELNSL